MLLLLQRELAWWLISNSIGGILGRSDVRGSTGLHLGRAGKLVLSATPRIYLLGIPRRFHKFLGLSKIELTIEETWREFCVPVAHLLIARSAILKLGGFGTSLNIISATLHPLKLRIDLSSSNWVTKSLLTTSILSGIAFKRIEAHRRSI